MTIPVAHDFICPWCWVALLQAKRLKAEFGVSFDWVGYELFPDELAWPEPGPDPVPPPANKPPVPTRFEFIAAADGVTMPTATRPKRMRTHNALESVEFAKTVGKQDEFIEILYRAYWERGEEINNVEVILSLANGVIDDLAGLRAAIERRSFKDQIIGFDDAAYAAGVYNVPTYFIGEQRLAEQPYSVLRSAVSELVAAKVETELYTDLTFPAPPVDRPYVFVNMVTTIDGKIVSGERGEPVSDLGSKVDHLLMDRTIAAGEAILIGAGTLRASGNKWNPKIPIRIVVSRSGDVDYESGYLSGGQGYVATSNPALSGHGNVQILRFGEGELDFKGLLKYLRTELKVERVVVLGGADLNGHLIREDLVDELFLTVAPKIKLGDGLPNYAGGSPLARPDLKVYSIVETHVIGDEVFVRYRRRDI